jgi:hypothetical protein
VSLDHPFSSLPHFISSLMMSMIVAQISSTHGRVSSVAGEETMNWGRLALSSLPDLTSLASQSHTLKKRSGNKSSAIPNVNEVNPEPAVE